jgi:hypothetical protein
MKLNCALTGKKCPIRFEDWYKTDSLQDRTKQCSCYRDTSMWLFKNGRDTMVKNLMCRYFGETRCKELSGSRWADE